MPKSIQSRIVLIIPAFIVVYFVAQLMLTDLITNTNVITFNSHYQHITQNWTRGEFSYDLLTTEGESYKIAADYADCFRYSDFLSNVTPGQPVIIKVRKNNGYIFSDIKVVTSFEVNGKSYLNQSCFNQRLSTQKFFAPLAGLAVLFIAYILLLHEEKKPQKRKHKR